MDDKSVLLAFCRELINNIPEAIDQPPNVTAGLTPYQMAFMLRVIRTRAAMIIRDSEEIDPCGEHHDFPAFIESRKAPQPERSPLPVLPLDSVRGA